MEYSEWIRKWNGKLWGFRTELNDGKEIEGFDKNLITIFEFPDFQSASNAYYEIWKNEDKKKYGDYSLGGFCMKEDNSRYIKIHKRCPDLPLVLKICEAFGGICYRWESSLLESPPIGGGIYMPKENTSKNSGGCYIATACYGSYDCTQVLTFRNFRDEYLRQRIVGRIFIKIYYTFSPSIAHWLRD